VRDFEQRRDAAQLAAALDRWQQGDPAAARAMLQRLVERRPDHFEARLRLGELLWSEGDGQAAEHQLREALALRPDAAEAHHALGLVLWGTGRQAEGQQHLQKAAALAPDNEAYRLACQP
jgi:Tfp pilus assembly protein PilF